MLSTQFPFFGPSEVIVWPRGYPLDKINAEEYKPQECYCAVEVPSHRAAILKFIANHTPEMWTTFFGSSDISQLRLQELRTIIRWLFRQT
jgi:hypothetical protein